MALILENLRNGKQPITNAGAISHLVCAKMTDYVARMYTVAELVELARVYMAAKGIPASRLSVMQSSHNRLFERLMLGFDCRAEQAERASRWFDDNWPPDLDWPKTVVRQHKQKAHSRA